MKKFSAKRESFITLEPTFVVCFNGIAVIERGCSAARAQSLVKSLNTALKKVRAGGNCGRL